MPGESLRAHRKARTLEADVIILDLEDATSPERKGEARSQVVATLEEGGFREQDVAVRINGLGSPWIQDDLQALASARFDVLVLPKVEHAAELAELHTSMHGLGFRVDLRIWCMIETPLGVLHAESIASSGNRLECLVLGTSDLTKALHARHRQDRLPTLHSLSHCLLAGRAHGLSVLDGVHLNIDDDQGFLETCELGRDLGFDGRTLIHPRQIAACNEVYSPSNTELTDALRTIDAYRTSRAQGRGLATVDGRLIEQLHVDEAMRLLALADRIEARSNRLQGIDHE